MAIGIRLTALRPKRSRGDLCSPIIQKHFSELSHSQSGGLPDAGYSLCQSPSVDATGVSKRSDFGTDGEIQNYPASFAISCRVIRRSNRAGCEALACA